MSVAYQNRLLFLRWARQAYPQAYAASLVQRGGSSSALGDLISSMSDAFSNFTNTVTNLAQTYVTARAQIDWLKVNAQRAKDGLPPLDPATGQPIAAANLPAPAANSQAAQIEAQLAGSANAGPPGWVWLAGAGVLALVLSRAL